MCSGNSAAHLTPADSVGRLEQPDFSGEATKVTLPDSGRLIQSDSLSEVIPVKPPWWRVTLLPVGLTVLVGGVLWLLFTQRGN